MFVFSAAYEVGGIIAESAILKESVTELNKQ